MTSAPNPPAAFPPAALLLDGSSTEPTVENKSAQLLLPSTILSLVGFISGTEMPSVNVNLKEISLSMIELPFFTGHLVTELAEHDMASTKL